MTITLLITQPPTSLLACHALEFAQAACQPVHGARFTTQIKRLFFYHEGVKQAHRDNAISQQWHQLMMQHQIPVTVCSGSAAKFALNQENSLLPIAGMGDWLMATLESDRMVAF